MLSILVLLSLLITHQAQCGVALDRFEDHLDSLRKLRDEDRTKCKLEQDSLKRTIDSLQETIEKKSSECATLIKSQESLQTAIKTKDAEYSDLKKSYESLDSLRKLNDEDRTKCKLEQDSQKRTIDSLQETIEKKSSEYATLIKSQESLQTAIKTKDAEYSDLKKSYESQQQSLNKYTNDLKVERAKTSDLEKLVKAKDDHLARIGNMEYYLTLNTELWDNRVSFGKYNFGDGFTTKKASFICPPNPKSTWVDLTRGISGFCMTTPEDGLERIGVFFREYRGGVRYRYAVGEEQMRNPNLKTNGWNHMHSFYAKVTSISI